VFVLDEVVEDAKPFMRPRPDGVHIGSLELEHARHDCNTVLDPVRDLPEEHLLARKRRVKTSLRWLRAVRLFILS
jgi:hypothetical protein